MRPYGVGMAQAIMDRKAARVAAVEAATRGQPILATAIMPPVVAAPQPIVQSQHATQNMAAPPNSNVPQNVPSVSPVQSSILPSQPPIVQAGQIQPQRHVCLTNQDKLIRGNRKLGLAGLHPHNNRRR